MTDPPPRSLAASADGMEQTPRVKVAAKTALRRNVRLDILYSFDGRSAAATKAGGACLLIARTFALTSGGTEFNDFYEILCEAVPEARRGGGPAL